jgi:hypothetical protein
MRQHLNETPVVIVHNYLESFRNFLSRSGDENTLLDRRFNGDQALFWLGDPKVVISSASIENAELLCQRWGYSNTKTLSPKEMSVSLSKDILREPHLRQAIIDLAGPDKRVALVPYATTSEFFNLAETLRIENSLDVLLPESTTPENLWVKDSIDSKVGFRSVISQISTEDKPILIPLGFTCVDLEQTIEAADWFRRRGKGCVVKANIGGSGVGNLFLPLEIIPDKSNITSLIEEDNFLADDILVVEELILSPGKISPSVEYYLPPKGLGKPQITYLCDQLFESSGRFAGVVISNTLEQAPWWPDMVSQAQLIAQHLQDIGYIGYFDLDTIVDQDCVCHFVEINSRRTGGTYAHEFMEYKFGLDYKERFSILSQNKASSGKLRTLEDLENVIGDLLYPISSTERGVIVLLTSMLTKGYFGYLIIDDSIAGAKQLRQQMLSRLKEY